MPITIIDTEPATLPARPLSWSFFLFFFVKVHYRRLLGDKALDAIYLAKEEPSKVVTDLYTSPLQTLTHRKEEPLQREAAARAKSRLAITKIHSSQ